MIHYHHIVGMGPHDTQRWLTGRHGLVSMVRPDYIELALNVTQTMILDNGAFTVWKQGGTLDVEGFTRWVESLYKHPAVDWALIPDVIEGSESDNDALVRDWPAHLPGVPVWHMHEDITRLERLCAEWRIVALGSSGAWSSPGSKEWWNRMSDVMDAICDESGRPPCKLHGLRMLDPKIFTRFPLSSADSISAVRNCNQQGRFGTYVPPTPSYRAAVIADRIESYSSAAVWERVDQKELFQLS